MAYILCGKCQGVWLTSRHSSCPDCDSGKNKTMGFTCKDCGRNMMECTCYAKSAKTANRFDRDDEPQPQQPCINCGGSGKAYIDHRGLIQCTCSWLKSNPGIPYPESFTTLPDSDNDIQPPLTIEDRVRQLESEVIDLQAGRSLNLWLVVAIFFSLILIGIVAGSGK